MDDDPVIPKLQLFESEFQKFMHGAYTHCLEEDWERFYAHLQKHTPEDCPHGKTRLTCPVCYFQK